MRKKQKAASPEDIVQELKGLTLTTLADIRGGDGPEPSPDDDNNIRAHIIETG